MGWSDYMNIVDASSFGTGGIFWGELMSCRPTVFQLQWPPDVTASVLSDKNRGGISTDFDLEMAGLLLLWLMIEQAA